MTTGSDSERFRRIAALAERYQAEGSAVLQGCTPDEIRELREIFSTADSPLDHQFLPLGMIASLAAQGTEQEHGSAPTPPTVPGYRTLGLLGRGSHAMVWEAVALTPPQRAVAIKVLTDSGVACRFDRERTVIGRMSHEGIAKIFASGTTSSGEPYFVMEIVRGCAFDVACRALQLDLRQRVSILSSVCRAVQHAHDREVLHRDLKPSNILVERAPAGPVVKVIDFGIAKALGANTDAAATSTMAGQLVGTPLYMSPEQLRSPCDDLDVRTDVYALGTVLFEAVTGRTRWSTQGLSLAAALAMMGCTPPLRALQAAPRLDRDLAAIVERAVAEDRDARYRSMRELGDDLDRWLRGEPVTARRPGTFRTAWWTARRHKTAATVTVSLGLAVVGLGTAAYTRLQQQDSENQTLRTILTETVPALAELAQLPGGLEQRDRLTAFLVDELASKPGIQNAEFRSMLAQAYQVRAEVLRERGLIAACADLRMRALELREAIAHELPSAATQRNLALALILVGDAEREGRLSDRFLERFRAAHEIYESLSNRPAADRGDRLRLAWSHDRLCDVTWALSNSDAPAARPEEGHAWGEEARFHAREMQRLVDATESVDVDLATLASILHARVAATGRILLTADSAIGPVERTRLHARCVDDAARLVATSPGNRTYSHLYATRLCAAAWDHAMNDRTDAAEALGLQAMAFLDSELRKDPANLDTRYHLAEAHANAAAVRSIGLDLTGALAAIEEGHRIAEPLLVRQPNNPAYAGVMTRFARLRDEVQRRAERARANALGY